MTAITYSYLQPDSGAVGDPSAAAVNGQIQTGQKWREVAGVGCVS
jgi:hypothetical protein